MSRIICFFIVLFYLAPLDIHASYSFKEDFNTGFSEIEKWNVLENGGQINFTNEYITLQSNEPRKFPYIYSDDIFPENQDFVAEFSIKFNSHYYNYGTGFSISDNLPINDVPVHPGPEHSIVVVWPLPEERFVVASSVCPENNPSCTDDYTFIYTVPISDFSSWHTIRLEFKNNQYKVFINDSHKFTSKETQRVPKYIWIGNPIRTMDNVTWSTFSLDFITIGSFEQQFNPIIFIPGLYGSWNTEMFWQGYKAVGPWGPHPPGLKQIKYDAVYNNLLETLKLSGYSDDGNNQNLYTFHYNFLAPLSDNPSSVQFKLKEAVDSALSNKPEGTKVDIVAHSMGGLVARLYLESLGPNKVNKLITLGSPHQGAIKAYQAWEGGKLDLVGEIIYFPNLFLRKNRKDYTHKALLVRNIAPSLQQLIPTFDFLKKEDGSPIPAETIQAANSWLKDKVKNLPAFLTEITLIIYGELSEAINEEWLVLKDTPSVDSMRSIWRDGIPIESQTEYTTQGDNTVLTKSTQLNGFTSYLLENKDHEQIINSEEGIREILNFLGISQVNPVINTYPDPKPLLVITVYSPVNIKVITPDGEVGHGVSNPLPGGIYVPENKLIIIPNAQANDYQVQLTGTGEGVYHLEIGQIIDKETDFWQTIKGKIVTDQVVNFTLDFNPDSPLENPVLDSQGNLFLELVKQQLEDLKEYINTNVSDLATKRRLQYEIQRIIRYLDYALIYVQRQNYYYASRYTFASFVYSYRLRQSIDQYYKEQKISEPTTIYLKNDLQDSNQLLAESWQNLYEKSGKTVSQEKASGYNQLLQRMLPRIETEISIEAEKGENQILGASFALVLEKMEKTQEYLDQGEYNQAYINSVASRLLLLETLYLMR